METRTELSPGPAYEAGREPARNRKLKMRTFQPSAGSGFAHFKNSLAIEGMPGGLMGAGFYAYCVIHTRSNL